MSGNESGAQKHEGGMAASGKSAKRKKLGIVLGVVAAVIVVAGAGFWVWHEQPSFCNAICHTPMDAYVATYDQQSGQAGVDKWGNEVSDAGSMMAVAHREAGEDCLSCHVPTMSEQVSEGINWISGNYYFPLTERTSTNLTAARGLEGDQFCLNEGCHDVTTREELVAATSGLDFNPHVTQHEERECTDCHKAHRASVMVCSECHAEAEVPEGWLSVAETGGLETYVQ